MCVIQSYMFHALSLWVSADPVMATSLAMPVKITAMDLAVMKKAMIQKEGAGGEGAEDKREEVRIEELVYSHHSTNPLLKLFTPILFLLKTAVFVMV